MGDSQQDGGDGVVGGALVETVLSASSLCLCDLEAS